MSGRKWDYEMSEGMKNLVARQMCDAIKPLKFGRFMQSTPPPSLWERLKWRLQDYRDRIVLAWRALKGEDLRGD